MELAGRRTVMVACTPMSIRIGIQILDQRLHLADFLALRCVDAIGQFAYPWISDVGPFACQNRDPMMRNHGPHPRHVFDRGLTARQPQCYPRHECTADEDQGVDGPIFVHPEHEDRSDCCHRRAHDLACCQTDPVSSLFFTKCRIRYSSNMVTVKARSRNGWDTPT